MIDRRALPGFAAGIGGLIFSVIGLLTEQLWLIAAAGICALFAGVFTLGLADRLRSSRAAALGEQSRASNLADETKQMAARAARFEAEAISARHDLADAFRAAGRTSSERPGGTVVDPLTGLFNESFFNVTLDKRVAAARRGLRPLSVVLIEVSTRPVGEEQRPELKVKAVAAVLLKTLRDADTACRLSDHLFAVILEDTPETGAVWTVQRVREELEGLDQELTLWAGVACYPAHAFEVEEILGQAQIALQGARDWHTGRIEVAAVPRE